MSLTAIVSPPIMTNLFSYFTSDNAVVYFPGVPFLAGALLICLSILFAIRTLASHSYHGPVARETPHPGSHEDIGS